jgi:hypothetical protein
MSSTPRRTTADAKFGEDQGTMQEITISGNDNDAVAIADQNRVAGQESPVAVAEPIVLGKSMLRRYSGWIALVIASSISYASLATEITIDRALGGRKFAFTVLGVTMVVSIIIASVFIAPDLNPCARAFISPTSYVGRFSELALTFTLLVFWCLGLPTIMNPANELAVGYDQILNANLYLGSWVCFACVIYLIGDLVGDLTAGPEGSAIGLSRLDPETGEYVSAVPFSTIDYKRFWETRRGKFFGLFAVTGVALSASVREYQAFTCKEIAMQSSNTCIDSKVAIASTVMSGVLCLVMMSVGTILGGSMPEYIESLGAGCTTLVWTLTVAFVTFGDGPGHSLGNLFFATWGGFSISVLITADCFREYISKRALAAAAEAPQASNGMNNIELQGVDAGDDNDI